MLTACALLFASSFLAATLLPGTSEVALATLVARGGSPVVLAAVATAGNTLGSLVNWLLGRYLLEFRHRRWFYFSEGQIERGQRWFNRYGVWSLLLAWLPVVGDVLTLIAGVMRVPLWTFVLLVAIGKAGRYIALISAQQALGLG